MHQFLSVGRNLEQFTFSLTRSRIPELVQGLLVLDFEQPEGGRQPFDKLWDTALV
jgi:hypothetical protein